VSTGWAVVLGLLGFVVLIFRNVITNVCGKELWTRFNQLPEVLLWLAVRQLPREWRDDLRGEWRAELDAIPRETSKEVPLTQLGRRLRFAGSLLLRGRIVAREFAGRPSRLVSIWDILRRFVLSAARAWTGRAAEGLTVAEISVRGAAALQVTAAMTTMFVGAALLTQVVVDRPLPQNIARSPSHVGLDVSTMAAGQRFYAVPDFHHFQSCGRPCWLPLYQQPTELSAFVTDGWPCEYYSSNTSSEPACVQPPSRRTQSEMENPATRDSGDRILVICQVTLISKGQAAQTIRNEADQSSNIWDMVAVPESYTSSDSTATGRLRQVPGMPRFYEAYGPDIWFGNTGWHSIPCK
jgi:hypothetical protein